MTVFVKLFHRQKRKTARSSHKSSRSRQQQNVSPIPADNNKNIKLAPFQKAARWMLLAAAIAEASGAHREGSRIDAAEQAGNRGCHAFHSSVR